MPPKRADEVAAAAEVLALVSNDPCANQWVFRVMNDTLLPLTWQAVLQRLRGDAKQSQGGR